MRISCAKSVGCGFVTQSQLPAIMATTIQFSYLKWNSYKVAPAVNNVLLFKVIFAITWLTSTMVEIYFGSSLANCRVPPYSIHWIHSEVNVGPIQKFWIRHNRILSIQRISDFRSVGFGIHHILTCDSYFQFLTYSLFTSNAVGVLRVSTCKYSLYTSFYLSWFVQISML